MPAPGYEYNRGTGWLEMKSRISGDLDYEIFFEEEDDTACCFDC